MGYRRRRKTITLKYAAKCRDCGAELSPGTTARWYGRGRVYGLTCHEDSRVRQGREIKGTVGDPVPAGVYHDPMEEGAQLEERLSDDVEAIQNGPIPQTRMFD